jgi:RimJ/RimL family protein N-acetyltransferase
MSYSIRPPRPDDAVGIIALLASVSRDPINNIGREPDDPMFTEEQEREYLATQAARPDWCGFAAVSVSGEVVGMVTIDGKRRRAMRHCGVLGVSVRADCRGQGVGRALMERAIAWARESGVITRVELQVLARNATAISLYERLGFQLEGRHPRAFYRGGEYLDDLTMGLLI